MSTPTIVADAAPRARYRALLFGAVAVAILSLPVIATAAPAAAGQVTTVLDGDCDNYGYDVTNHDTVPHTVTMTVGGTAGAPVVVDSGQTKHLALDPNTEPATAVQITDSDGTVIADDVLRFCVTTDDITATIKANTSYTLDLGSPASPVIEAPAP